MLLLIGTLVWMACDGGVLRSIALFVLYVPALSAGIGLKYRIYYKEIQELKRNLNAAVDKN